MESCLPFVAHLIQEYFFSDLQHRPCWQSHACQLYGGQSKRRCSSPSLFDLALWKKSHGEGAACHALETILGHLQDQPYWPQNRDVISLTSLGRIPSLEHLKIVSPQSFGVCLDSSEKYEGVPSSPEHASTACHKPMYTHVRMYFNPQIFSTPTQKELDSLNCI